MAAGLGTNRGGGKRAVMLSYCLITTPFSVPQHYPVCLFACCPRDNEPYNGLSISRPAAVVGVKNQRLRVGLMPLLYGRILALINI